jgi:hypothetical protein
MGSQSRIGRLFAIGVVGVAALLVVGLLPGDEDGPALGHPADSITPPARSVAPPAVRPPGALPETDYQARLAARLMFIHPRRDETSGAVYPAYPTISDSGFARELRDVFVPMSVLFDTLTVLDALDRAGPVSPIRIDPMPGADSLLRFNADALGGAGNLQLRFDVHGSLIGHVAPRWMVALARGTTESLPLTPWGSKGRERAIAEGRRLAELVSDDTVSSLKGVPFRVVSYDRFDVDGARLVIVRAIREAKHRPGDSEVVTLIGQSLGDTDEFAPIWSFSELRPDADFSFESVVAALRMGSARRPVVLIEQQPEEDVCSGDGRGYFLALMDDGRWRDVGFWGPGC